MMLPLNLWPQIDKSFLSSLPKEAPDRRISGSFKYVTFGSLRCCDGSTINVAIAKPIQQRIDNRLPYAERDPIAQINALAQRLFQKEAHLLTRCRDAGIEGIAYPLGFCSYRGKQGQLKHRMVSYRYNQGDLLNVMNQLETYPSRIIKSMQEQLITIVASIARTRCVLRDMKPENCLVDIRNGACTVALCDISSLHILGDLSEIELAGTFLYMPPEYAKFLRYPNSYQNPSERANALSRITQHPVDAWALGAILLGLEHPESAVQLFDFPPEIPDDVILNQRVDWYHQGEIPASSLQQAPEHSMMRVIQGLLQTRPDRRWTAARALEAARCLDPNREIFFRAQAQ